MSPFDAVSDADALALARTMLDGVTHPIVLLSPEGMVLAVNRPARQLAGDQETVGRLLWEADWGATTEGWRELLRAAVEKAAGDASVRLELNARGPGRHPLPGAGPGHVIEVALEPWRSSRGVRHVVVSLHDITLRHRAARRAADEASARQEALRMSELLQEQATELEAANEELQVVTEELEERTAAAEHGERKIRTILESIGDAFFALDDGWRFTYVNDRAARLLRRPRSELIGGHIWTIFPQAVGSLFWQEYHRARRDGTKVEFEEFFAPFDSWLEVHAYPSEDGLSVYFRDVTGRRHAAEELRESEQRYRLLFERHPLPMWVFDLETLRFLAVNESALRRYGYSRDEFLGMTIEHIRPESAAEALRAIIPGADTGLHQAGIFVHRLRDGALRQMDIISHSLQFDGRDARLVLAHDVTERLEAERALREREEQLRHALKMEAVGRLAGGVAHDFNNLLTVISGNLDFARAALPDDSPAQPDLAEVSAAAERAATLTRQLLAVSRKQLLHPRLIDLGHTVAQAKRLLQRVIGENIVLELAWPGEAWAVHADPGQMDQVLLNLVVNARDAMPGGGTITIEVANSTLDAGAAGALDIPVAEGSYVVLTVRDTGSGMDAVTRERAVEPFFTTKAAGQGTGLGLSTVYGIVTQSGGGLRIESTPGSGTSVSILLPRAVGVASSRTDEEARGARGAGETILVVEDETSVRGVIRRTLERHGYTVREARHGGDALLVWERERDALSLVVTDIVMPELGGRELAARLRAEQPDLPILFLSGYAGGTAGGEPLADDEPFLYKPFAGEELLRQVGALLDRRRQGALAAGAGDPPGPDQ